MNIVFLKSFEKDLSRLTKQSDKKAIIQVIEMVKNANDIEELSGIKKLKGAKQAYRLRVGHYRIGVFIEKNVVEFARVLHRKDIYNVFP
jgi:mRNA interferase RelE/StbE